MENPVNPVNNLCGMRLKILKLKLDGRSARLLATRTQSDTHGAMPATLPARLATSVLRTLRAAVPVLLVGVPAALGTDWPQFRGPHRDGVWDEVGILESFPREGLKIRWRHPVGGGFASPVVVQGRVFVFDVDLAKPVAKERLHCFEEKTGKVLWMYAYEEKYGEWSYVPERGA